MLRTATVLVGHLGGFGLLWAVQFVVLDRVLFGRTRHAEPMHHQLEGARVTGP